MDYRIEPFGDQGIMVELGEGIGLETHRKVMSLATFLDDHPPAWMRECIPAFATVAIFFDPFQSYDFIYEDLSKILVSLAVGELKQQRLIEIPVCYGLDYGPDLEEVAHHNKLTPEEVIYFHSTGEYLVYMIGFAPGFPYIGGMPEEIAAPRRSSPRMKIPAGSVGIGGKQTGVYPLETPGGWQLIGRTPLKLFLPNADQPSLLQAGDRIRFKAITAKAYRELQEEEQ